MATIRKIWACKNSQCKTEKGKHRGYKKVNQGEKKAPLCKWCQTSMILGECHVTRITVDGQTHTKTVSPNEKLAKSHLDSCIEAARTGNLIPGTEPDITWEMGKGYFFKWIDSVVEDETLSNETAIFYRSGIKPLDSIFKGRTLQSITKAEVEAFKKKRVKDVTKGTVNHSLASLKRLFSINCEDRTARRFPRLHETLLEIRKVKLYTKLENARNNILETDEEIDVFLSYCKAPNLYLFAFGILNTGLRHTDMLKLRIEEISFPKNEITTVVKGKKKVTIPLT